MPRLSLFCRFWMHMMNYQYLARLLGKGGAIKGIDTYAEHVCRRRRDRGMKNFIFSFDGMLYFRFTW